MPDAEVKIYAGFGIACLFYIYFFYIKELVKREIRNPKSTATSRSRSAEVRVYNQDQDRVVNKRSVGGISFISLY